MGSRRGRPYLDGWRSLQSDRLHRAAEGVPVQYCASGSCLSGCLSAASVDLCQLARSCASEADPS
eukprot:13805457-Heterocapsa_arctica.AAC.1